MRKRKAEISSSTTLLRDAILRVDFYAFVQRVFRELRPGDRFSPNWHLDAICHEVMQMVDGTNQRLLVTVPPRSLKSIIISVALPAFVLGRNPTRRIVCISYAEDLAVDLANQFRKVIASSWYRRLFPKMVTKRNTDREITTTRGGSRFATSIKGPLTGRGGNLFIIDDPIKPVDALSKPKRDETNLWLRNTLASRPDDKLHDKMTMLMQRVHAEDPAGAVLASGGWKHLNLPAIADRDEVIRLSYGKLHRRFAGSPLDENREPLSILQELRHQMGDFDFAAQYLQAPNLPDGGIFKRAWFRLIDQNDYPYDDPSWQIIQSWDTAMVSNDNADWSVCTTWLVVRDCFYLIDIFRKRLVYPDLKAAILNEKQVYKPSYLIIEDKGAGTSLIQDLYNDKVSVEPYRCSDPKEVRAGRASVAINQGRVFLPAEQDPAIDLFLDEALAFPGGRHDDQVDSMVQAIDWWENQRQTPTAMFGRY
ncbi:MAG: phage terminase large subunit [Mesorhizobium sp.]|nr:phage terminase large subunit [Mesorhizobium sp.]